MVCPFFSYPPQDATLFPIGTTSVTVAATDAAGNYSQTSFNVIVQRGGRLLVPQDITVEATCPGGAYVTFAPATITAPGTITYADGAGDTVQSGDLFPVGLTAVKVSAAYDDGRTQESWFNIFVQDTIAPVVTLTPATDISVAANRPGGADGVAYPIATATDAVTASPAVWFEPASDTTFPIGGTTVTAYAMDESGNLGTATFTVTVAQGALVVSNVAPQDYAVIFDALPLVSAHIADSAAGAAMLSYTALLDGDVLASNANVPVTVAGVDVSFTPSGNLTVGWHRAKVIVTDDLGNSTTVHWDFFVAGAGITIYDESPAQGTTVSETQPLISAFFADNAAAIDPSTLVVTLISSGNVSIPVYISYSDATSFYAFPAQDLDPDTYTVTASISDFADPVNSATASWSFTVPSPLAPPSTEPATTPATLPPDPPYPGSAVGSGGQDGYSDAFTGISPDTWDRTVGYQVPVDISFHGNIKSITSDDRRKTYSAPHWADNNWRTTWQVAYDQDYALDGYVETAMGDDRNYPVAYVAGTPLTISATFATHWQKGWICAIGELKDGNTGALVKEVYFPWQRVGAVNAENDYSQYIVRFPETAAHFEAGASDGWDGDSFEPGVARYSQPLEIRWYFVPGDVQEPPKPGTAGAPSSPGSTFHTLYVTADQPQTPQRQWTVFHLSCTQANGLNVRDDPQKAVDTIFATFEAPKLCVPRWDNTPAAGMTYFHPEDEKNEEGYTADDLLKNTWGRCGGWADFLAACCRLQGITGIQDNLIKLIDRPGLYPDLIYVKNVDYSGYFKFPRQMLNLNVPGIPGQGNPNPWKKFDGHEVVCYGKDGMTIYDPSYGKTYSALTEKVALWAWQRGSLDLVNYRELLGYNAQGRPVVGNNWPTFNWPNRPWPLTVKFVPAAARP